jgi:hypothetical protein
MYQFILRVFLVVIGFSLTLLVTSTNSEAKTTMETDVNWRVEASNSLATSYKKAAPIAEAVYSEETFFDKMTIIVSCRYSYPEPSIFLKLPDLSTDIIYPKSNAIVTFSDKKLNPYEKSHRNNVHILNAIVKHGDFVLVPSLTSDKTSNLLDVFNFLSDNEQKGVYMMFKQNKKLFNSHIKLKGFKEAYAVAVESCKTIS